MSVAISLEQLTKIFVKDKVEFRAVNEVDLRVSQVNSSPFSVRPAAARPPCCE